MKDTARFYTVQYALNGDALWFKDKDFDDLVEAMTYATERAAASPAFSHRVMNTHSITKKRNGRKEVMFIAALEDHAKAA